MQSMYQGAPERGKERDSRRRVVVFITVVDSSFGLELFAAFPTTHNSLHEIHESL